MTETFALTDAERARVASIDELAASGAAGVASLIALADDPSWTVRRAAVASLASLGDLAAPAMVVSLRERRTSERAIAALVDALSACLPGVVEDEVRAMLHAPVAAIVADAAVILGRRGARTAIGDLRALLVHPDDNVAVAAIEAIGAIGGTEALDPLIEVAERRQFFRTFPALQVLARSQDPRAITVLASLLGDPLYRDDAAAGLGRSGVVQAIEPLVRLLDGNLDNGGDATLLLVARALGEALEVATWNGTIDRLVGSLRVRLARHCARLAAALPRANPAERHAITLVLGHAGDVTAIAALGPELDDATLGPEAVVAIQRIATAHPAQLGAILASSDAGIRAAALPAARTRDSTGAVAALLVDPIAEIRARACDALARIGDTRLVPMMFDLLADPSPRVAHAAMAAIDSLGSGATAPLVTAALAHPNANVRRHALRIVAYLGLGAAFDAVRARIDDPDPRVSELAATAAGGLEHPGAEKLVEDLATRPDAALRGAAMRAAAGRSGDKSLAVLVRGLDDESPWVRYYACKGLGQRRHRESLDALVARVQDDAPHVRIAAIEALAGLRGPAVWDALAIASRSTDPDVRRATLAAMASYDREAAVPLLVAAATDPEIATQLIALAGLAASPASIALVTLIHAARDPRPEICNAAVSLLSDRDDTGAADALADLVIEMPHDHPAHAALSRPGISRVHAIASRLHTAHDVSARALAAALARMAGKPATTILFDMLTSANPAARRAAVTTLDALGASDARASIDHMAAHDPDFEVRRVCAALRST